MNIDNEGVNGGECELNRLLPPSGLETSKNLSSSAPGAISDQNCSLIQMDTNSELNSGGGNSSSIDVELRHRASKDSAMEDENCHSISCFTDSTEQSAPVNFDMSNRVGKRFSKQNKIFLLTFSNNCCFAFKSSFSFPLFSVIDFSFLLMLFIIIYLLVQFVIYFL